MRTTVEIDDALYRCFETRAAEAGRTVSEVIEEALGEWAAMRASGVRRKRGAAGVDLSSNAALRDVLDADVLERSMLTSSPRRH